MSAKIIDGKSIAARVRGEVREEIAELGIKPGLGVILVGDDPASHLYVSLKEKACAEVGIKMEKRLFPASAKEKEVVAAVNKFNRRDDIDGILVQLPLPAPLDEDRVIAAIDPAKDADGFHPDNVAALMKGQPTILPGLVAGIMELITASTEDLTDEIAVVVGNSRTFFEPLAVVLRHAGLTPQFLTPADPNLAEILKTAKVVIVAVGKARFVKGDMIRQGAVVIDVGTNKVDGKTVGDVDFDSVKEVAGHVSPVPGGVGPMTVAMLLVNTVALAKRRRSQ